MNRRSILDCGDRKWLRNTGKNLLFSPVLLLKGRNFRLLLPLYQFLSSGIRAHIFYGLKEGMEKLLKQCLKDIFQNFLRFLIFKKFWSEWNCSNTTGFYYFFQFFPLFPFIEFYFVPIFKRNGNLALGR